MFPHVTAVTLAQLYQHSIQYTTRIYFEGTVRLDFSPL